MIGSMVGINGLFHLLLINGVFLGVITPLILTIDPNFLKHPSGVIIAF